MADDHGYGGIQSPPDDRDLVLSAEHVAGAVPASYRVAGLPPIRDQGLTPECVAYSSGYEQAKNDRDEFSRWVDFNEALFFQQIGGTAAGAIMRNALDRLVHDGYPEQDATPMPDRHRIEAYARVSLDRESIKAAIVRNNGILILGPWWDSWTSPVGDKATLPAPSGSNAGHAWWAVGYDEIGVIAQNSWGSAWGAKGRFRMPWYYVTQYMWEAWTTFDQATMPDVVRVKINAINTTIRTRAVLGDSAKMEGTRWGETRRAGIYRWSDGKIVATPWDRAFRFVRFSRGYRHGIGAWPDMWTVMTIAGHNLCVARPLAHLVL